MEMWTAGSSRTGLPAVFSNLYSKPLFKPSFQILSLNPFSVFFKSIYKYLTLPPYGFRLKSVVQSNDGL